MPYKYQLLPACLLLCAVSGGKGKYRDGTTFEQIMKVYDFDRILRRMLMTYLEEIEISMRAIISNYHAMKYGDWAISMRPDSIRIITIRRFCRK